jgi:hypothetical protein
MLKFKEPVITQFPSGKWGFVGRVPVALGCERKDGKPVTHEDARAASQCGPELAGLRAKGYQTKAAAEGALDAYLKRIYGGRPLA